MCRRYGEKGDHQEGLCDGIGIIYFFRKKNVQLDKMSNLDHEHFIYASYTCIQHYRVNRQTRKCFYDQRIIHYDSIHNGDTAAQKIILNYLEDDDAFKKGDMCSFDPDDWKIVENNDLPRPTAQQVDFLYDVSIMPLCNTE